MSEWISVSDRLPIAESDMTSFYEEIDVITWDGNDVTFNCFQAGKTMDFWSVFVDDRYKVTHWMPMPPPPESVKCPL